MNISTLLLIFILLSIVNVVLNTIKSIVTVKGSWVAAALINGLTFYVYTYVIIFTNCDLNMHLKAIITGLVNILGVAIVKYIEMKAQKDKVWRITATLKDKKEFDDCVEQLKKFNIGFSYIEQTKAIDIYSYNQSESAVIKSILQNYKHKYFIQEMAKSL